MYITTGDMQKFLSFQDGRYIQVHISDFAHLEFHNNLGMKYKFIKEKELYSHLYMHV